MNDPLSELLNPDRLTEVVDIGANPIDEGPPYKAMLAAGLCNVTGFEPQEQALAELQRKAGPHERYYPHVIGDGGVHTLNICRYSGMTSLLEPDAAVMSLFSETLSNGEVVRRIPGIQTRCLDDIDDIAALDMLKIDIQGGELSVFRNGRQKLADTVLIHTEMAFLKLYEYQPSFGDVDVELRRQGFIPYRVFDIRYGVMLSGSPDLINTRRSHQAIDGDVLYVKDYTHPESIADEQLKQLVLILHHCYQSHDVVLRCIGILEQRGAVLAGAQRQYAEMTRAG